MNTFKKFIKEDNINRGTRRFIYGDIVLVAPKLKLGSTTINADARPYANKIGTVSGYEKRSMASPYYLVTFDDGKTVRVINLFLMGPYESKEEATAEQSKASEHLGSKHPMYNNLKILREKLTKFPYNFKWTLPDLSSINEKDKIARREIETTDIIMPSWKKGTPHIKTYKTFDVYINLLATQFENGVDIRIEYPAIPLFQEIGESDIIYNDKQFQAIVNAPLFEILRFRLSIDKLDDPRYIISELEKGQSILYDYFTIYNYFIGLPPEMKRMERIVKTAEYTKQVYERWGHFSPSDEKILSKLRIYGLDSNQISPKDWIDAI